MLKMFLVQRGKGFSFVHSYRDGQGKVRQSRMHRFESATALRKSLSEPAWSGLQVELKKRFPQVRVDWERVHQKALDVLADCQDIPSTPPDKRILAIRRAARALKALLEAEEAPEVLRLAAKDIQELQSFVDSESHPERWLREGDELALNEQLEEAESAYRSARDQAYHQLPLGRRRFGADEPEAHSYLLALDRLAGVLERSNKLDQAAEVLRERLACCPEAAPRAALGALLHRLGKFEEAVSQFRCLPRSEATRHYNEAAALLQSLGAQEALPALLRALGRNPSMPVVLKRWQANQAFPERVKSAAQDYWERFGNLWNEKARQFLLAVASEPLVRWRLNRLGTRGQRVRKVLTERTMTRLLDRVQGKMNG